MTEQNLTTLTPSPKIEARDLEIRFGPVRALSGVTLAIHPKTIHALIGPAGSGKTSFLRTLNLLTTEVDGASVGGEVLVDGVDILHGGVELARLRRRIGMVFATPQPLPRSIYENLVFGPRLAGVTRRAALEQVVEESLRAAQLWEEVKDRLDTSALKLSGGQQQRLCIARSLALRPEVLLLDEPCSGLDPISTLKIEEALQELKREITIVLVTNNTKQAARVGDRVAFFLMGEMVEDGPADKLFTAPADPRTNDYLSGRFG
jgi:phosphate transport system ATP-binding protein